MPSTPSLRLCALGGLLAMALMPPLAAAQGLRVTHGASAPAAETETECQRLADFHIRSSAQHRPEGATDWTRVRALCQADVEVHPGDPRFIYSRGRAETRLKLYSDALRDFRTASEAGHVDALVELGALYYYGHGVLQSYPTAYADMSKAAAAGSSRALANVAAMTGNGQGVPKDDVKALDLAEQAIEAGNPDGLRLVANAYFNGAGVPRDYKMAAQYLQQSIDLGDGEAMKFLANMYEGGYLGPPDRAKASELRLRAQREDPDSPAPLPEHLPPLRQAVASPVVHTRRYVQFRPARTGGSMGQPMVGGIFQAPAAGATCCPPIALVCPGGLKPC